jgi:acetamidase/formamidase
MVINSGDTVEIEMITHHAGDDPDKMINGDPGVESIYKWNEEGMGVPTRGASGMGDGVHILTGPIAVCGAEPGDVLQVDILSLEPRVNPATGKTYGSNAAAWWGYQFRAGFLDGDEREVVTIYEVVEEDGEYYIVPDYQFRFSNAAAGYDGPTSACAITEGSIPDATTNIEWSNVNNTYSGREVPCTQGEQLWSEMYYPGVLTTHPTGTENTDINGKFKLKANMHIGNIGLAPQYATPVDSVPPLMSGGNMDNKRVAAGNTIFLPIQVAGAMLSAGDAHMAQGDSELDGTGVETSINGKLKLTLHKKDELPLFLQNLTQPLIETEDSWVIQGYTYSDYLTELDNPMSTIYGESSLDKAMTVAYNATRDFLMATTGMTEDQVITAITIATDFGITQVVDGNWGVHAIVPKAPFSLPTIGAVKSTATGGGDVPQVTAAAASGAIGIKASAILAASMALIAAVVV